MKKKLKHIGKNLIQLNILDIFLTIETIITNLETLKQHLMKIYLEFQSNGQIFKILTLFEHIW